MNDCPNADVRDLLPDLVNGRLDAAARARVEAHLVSCADCGVELELLRDLRSAFRRTPVIDVAAIAAAIPRYRAPARRSWVAWRTAAAITLLVAGGSSVALLNREPASLVGPSVPVERPTLPVVVDTTSVSSVRGEAASIVSGLRPTRRTTPDRDRGGRELAMTGGALTELSDSELDALLRDIESLDALPTTDVEAPSLSPIPPATPSRGTP